LADKEASRSRLNRHFVAGTGDAEHRRQQAIDCPLSAHGPGQKNITDTKHTVLAVILSKIDGKSKGDF
jgi:hypothetical protein